MIPNNDNYEDFDDDTDDDLSSDFEVETEPSLTYAMNLERNIFVGRVDDVEAIQQAILKIINTERYEHEIYSWDYGIELADLRGQSMPYVMSEIKERIIDAITIDDRIESADEFNIQRVDKHSFHVSFVVTTVQNDEFTVESEVEV